MTALLELSQNFMPYDVLAPANKMNDTIKVQYMYMCVYLNHTIERSETVGHLKILTLKKVLGGIISLVLDHTALFPGSTQLPVTCSMEKRT